MRYMCEQLRKACPGAFLVNIREDAAGSSFFPFVKSLYNALNYSKCTESGTPRRRRNNRRRLAVDDTDPDDPEAMVPLLCVDSNGCADGMWGPAFSADEELEMEATRQALKAIHVEEQEGSEVNMVKDSYALQRSHFNQAKTKTDWLRAFSNWPILQRTPAFLAHSNLLMGKSCQDVWADGLLNPKLFLNFMANYCAVLERNPTASGRWAFMTDHLQKSSDAALDEGNRPLKIAVFPLLLTYFQEEVHHFFLTVDANATLQEIRERVSEESNCPLLVVKGSSIYDATATFIVIVRGQFAISAETFVQGALIVLLSYFVFNIQYPKAIFRTLEFLQRYFLKVNPVCQSRKEGKEKTKLNSAVATLSNKLLSFEASQSRWNA